MQAPVTMLYAGLLGLVWLWLFWRVGVARNRAGVSLGDGGDKKLIETTRAHANFVEGVPLILVLLALVEGGGAARWIIHTLGAALVIARIAHPFGLDTLVMAPMMRMIGAGGTFVITAFASALALWHAAGVLLR